MAHLHHQLVTAAPPRPAVRRSPRDRQKISTNIPGADSACWRYFNNFARYVAQAEADNHFGLGRETSEELTAHAAAYEAAYIATKDPSRRTTLAIAHKNEVRKAALKAFRAAANRIKANPDIPAHIMVGLGFKVMR